MKANKKDNIHLPKKRIKEKKWFEKQITPEQFEIKQDKKGKFYAQHNEWKKTIWIGPYNTKDDANKVVASYIKETNKPFGKRKEIKNIHSIIIEDKKFWEF